MHLFFSPIGKLTLYLDPGTGSMVIQVVLAALLSVGVLVRVFWNKISSWFKPKRPRRAPTSIQRKLWKLILPKTLLKTG